MKKDNLLRRIYDLYADGFRQMTLGKTLWTVVVVKLVVIFAVLKVFFFPDYLKRHATGGDKAGFVATQLLKPTGGND